MSRRYLLRRHCRAGETPLAMEQQSLAVISCTAPEADIAAALRQHDSLVLMKVYGRFARIKALLAQAGLLDAALMMSEATLPGEQCWRRLREVSDDQPLPYFSTIRLTNSGRRRNESGEIAEAAFVWGLAAAVLLIIVPQEAFAMHIMEGFCRRCGRWRGGCCFTLPVVRHGAPAAYRREESNQKVLLALCGAFILFFRR